jgi:hypothetical protein
MLSVALPVVTLLSYIRFTVRPTVVRRNVVRASVVRLSVVRLSVVILLFLFD